MRLLLLFLTLAACKHVYSQIDTVYIAQEPVEITKEVYFAAPKKTYPVFLNVSFGLPYTNNFGAEESKNRNQFGNFLTTAKAEIQVNRFELGLGLSYGNLKYSQSQKKMATEWTSNKTTISDTVVSFIIKPEVYEDGIHYDTTWINTIHSKDTVFQTPYDTLIEQRTNSSAHILYVPLSVGYVAKFKNMDVVFSVEFSPVLRTDKKNLKMNALLGSSIKVRFPVFGKVYMGGQVDYKFLQRYKSEVNLPKSITSANLFLSLSL